MQKIEANLFRLLLQRTTQDGEKIKTPSQTERGVAENRSLANPTDDVSIDDISQPAPEVNNDDTRRSKIYDIDSIEKVEGARKLATPSTESSLSQCMPKWQQKNSFL